MLGLTYSQTNRKEVIYHFNFCIAFLQVDSYFNVSKKCLKTFVHVLLQSAIDKVYDQV